MKPNRDDSESQQQAAEDALFRAVISLKSAAECRNFFLDLCTPAELQALVDRFYDPLRVIAGKLFGKFGGG